MNHQEQRQARPPQRGGGVLRCCSRSSHGRTAAFTLIELLAVIVIVAILSGVAMASLDSVSNRNVQFAANQTAEHLRYLRQRAMTVGHPMWITFDINADTLIMREDDPANPGFANSTVFVDPVSGKDATINVTTEFGGSVDLTGADFSGQTTIGFNWMGSPILADGSTFTLASGLVTFNNTVNIRVYGDTGCAVVEP